MTRAALHQVVCCLGQAVAGNPEQFLLEKSFETMGLDWRYLACEVVPEKLEAAILGSKALSFRGMVLLDCYQNKVAAYCDEVTLRSQKTGCITHIYQDGERYLGDDSFGNGFVSSFPSPNWLNDKHVVLAGSGRVARSLAIELGIAKVASLTITSRNDSKGAALAQQIADDFGIPTSFLPWLVPITLPEQCDLLIQATSISSGEEGDDFPLALDSLKKETWVVDVTYNPTVTQLVRDAKQKECPVTDGLELYVRSAASAFTACTSLPADLAAMRESVEEYLEL